MSHRARRTALAWSLALSSVCSAALAQSPTGAASAPSVSGRSGSVYVQCSGEPREQSRSEAGLTLLGIAATAGFSALLLNTEPPDADKRLTGAAGVAACDAALAGAAYEPQKARLALARAIHHYEAKAYDAAIADTRLIEGLAPTYSKELGFRESVALAAMDIEAAALLRKGDPAAAEATALSMAMAAPWDVHNLIQAARYVPLTAQMTPQKAAFLDILVRLAPQGLMKRSLARQWAGDWLGAAQDAAALGDIHGGFNPGRESPGFEAHQAIALSLGGERARANAAAANARRRLDELARSGKVRDEAATAELLDFQSICELADSGRLAEARAAFIARSRWTAPMPPAVAALAARLRSGAGPQELKGLLAQDPSVIRQEALQTAAVTLAERNDQADTLYPMLRPFISLADYKAYGREIWNVAKPPFLMRRSGKEEYQGEVMRASAMAVGAVPAAEKLLLSAALVARSRGKQGFVLFPTRNGMREVLVRFGNVGEPGFPQAAFLDAEAVIAALAPRTPDPKTAAAPG